jgi:adenosylhomocysteine nucleosidase
VEKDTVTGIVMATMLEAKPFVLGMSLTQSRKKPFAVFENDNVFLIISGIGKANAAMATGYLCYKCHPARVYNLGAAGATDFSHALGENFHITEIIEYDRHELTTKRPYIHHPDILNGFQTARLSTSDMAVLDPDDRKKISMNADLIDMEGASVAQACRKFDTKCFMFKFVSDTPDHAKDKDIVENIRRHRSFFYEFFIRSVMPVLQML